MDKIKEYSRCLISEMFVKLNLNRNYHKMISSNNKVIFITNDNIIEFDFDKISNKIEKTLNSKEFEKLKLKNKILSVSKGDYEILKELMLEKDIYSEFKKGGYNFENLKRNIT